jgi:murein DD-endopeptidase MepM/ murein hydrolase activator NlpD
MAKSKFQNLTIDVQQLKTLSISDRLDFLKSKEGGSILPNFTPSQLNDLFPWYYRRSFTDIGESFKAVSDRRNISGSVSGGMAELTSRSTSGLSPRAARDAAAAGQPAAPAWQRAVKEKYGVDMTAGEVGDAASLIRRKEGFRSRPYYDKNAWRIGYGSDTITRADGSTVKVTQGMQITEEDAERDLQRRIPEFQKQGIIQYVGQNTWDKLNDQTKAALTSLAYNYGSISRLDALKKAITSGDKNMIAQAVESYSGHNDGVNYNRRMEEARMIRGSSDSPTVATQIPQLPQGLEPKLVEEYNRMPAYQQRNFHRALNKAGNNDVAVGVNKMNELYVQNPNIADKAATQGSGFIHPVDGEVRSGFGPRERPTAGASSYHRGVDYRANPGSPVRAANDGKVVSAEESRGLGFTIVIDHGNGIKTKYAHLRSFDVKPGDTVSRGQNIAKSGGVPGEPGAGITTGPHLHYEVLRNDKRIDPLEFQRNSNSFSEPASAPRETPPSISQRGMLEYAGRPRQTVQPLQTPGSPAGAVSQQQQQQQEPAIPSEPTLPGLPALALGGEVKTDAQQLQAHSINKSRQRRDDMVVTDGAQPLFTMNSEEEMKFNPATGKVSVNPSPQGLKTNPDSLLEKLDPPSEVTQTDKTNLVRDIKQEQDMSQQPIIVNQSSGAPAVNSYDSIRDKTLEKMTPSFERAVARSRFLNSGDSIMGGHFDSGAANMS